MLIIGTAGHIDHGKSSIVKRLTGTDPDRLPEEKERGLTIDLGFAFYAPPEGNTIAFVDVPGHERFVKNMIAGAGGIDVVILVIAADDGWMPQSEEHFQVVRLLGVTHGFVVINKTDLVERDWLELLEQDVRERAAGTFLDGAPVFKVSAHRGDGFEALVSHLDKLAITISGRKDIGKPRLYIDRTFVRPGIGGVVTGTLKGGALTVGQTVSVWPKRKTGRIRSLQSNNQDVETAHPGQRTAVSLTGVAKEFLHRGGVIVDKTDLSYFERNPVLALSVEVLTNAPVKLTNRRRVLMIVGTTEVEGEIRLHDQKEIGPCRQGLIYFKPDDPVYCLVEDRYVLRLPTPMVTVGGGQVLDHLPHVPKQRHRHRLAYLSRRVEGSLEALILSELDKSVLVPQPSLLEYADRSQRDVEKEVSKLLQTGAVGKFRSYLHNPERLEEALELLRSKIAGFLEGKSHLKGLSLEQISQLSPFDPGLTGSLIDCMVSEGLLVKVKDNYNLAGRGMTLKGEVKRAYEDIMGRLRQQPLAPPTLKELTAGGKAYREAVKFILDSEQGYKCGTNLIFLQETWQEIVAFITDHLTTSDTLAVGDLRDAFGFTRKFAIPILEETDRVKLTSREGDVRVKGERFEEEKPAS